MQINTEFKIGQYVYFVYKEDDLQAIQVLKDKIEEIVITEQGVMYYGNKICEEFGESEIVDANDIDSLFEKIRELSNEVENEK